MLLSCVVVYNKSGFPEGEVCRNEASDLVLEGERGTLRMRGMLQVEDQRWMVRVRVAQCIRRRCGQVVCHWIFLIGEWWIRTAVAAWEARDQIQTVVGWVSLLEARRVESVLKMTTEMPVLMGFEVEAWG